MVNEEEIRLEGEPGDPPVQPAPDPAPVNPNPAPVNPDPAPVNPDPAPVDPNPAPDPQPQPQPQAQPEPENNDRNSSSGSKDPAENNGDPVDGEDKDPAEDENKDENLFIKEKANDPKEETQQPWENLNLEVDTGWLLAGLGLVVALLAFLVGDNIRRKMKRKKYTAYAAAPVSYSGTGSVGAAVHQDIGAREDQQDSYGISNPELYAQQGMMAVVADGMGGLANGKAVSSTLVRTFVDGFPQVSGYYSYTQDILLDLSIRANAQINQMLRGADRSGSTLVAALIRDGYLQFLTVGDSRIYLCRGGALLQLNREHTYQEELVLKAVNQEAALNQVRSDRQAHALTSYFGIGRIPSIDRNDEAIRLIPGDRILLASDGVFGTLSREQMEHALRGTIADAAQQMGDMIRGADRPHQDNNTLVILEYKG